ncbi:MAG: hypothetical protein HQM09_23365 [Candidatus Riflebacteria bacterium]|nr:hypothetical protein [Candidatus Riflebacteria bacterium]
MSDSSCPSISLLASFQKGRITGGEKNVIEEHLNSCDICRFTVSLPDVKPPAGFAQEARRVFELATQPRPIKLAFGQIWRIVCPDTDAELAILTSRDKHSLNAPHQNLRTCLLSFDFDRNELAKRGELLAETDDSSVGREFLIKTWDEQTILPDQLDQYFGQLSDRKARILKETLEMRISNPAIDENLSEAVLAFRARESAASSVFSKPYLMKPDTIGRHNIQENPEIPAKPSLPPGTNIFEIEAPSHLFEPYASNEENRIRYAAKTSENLEELQEIIYGRLRKIRQAKQFPAVMHLERTAEGFSLSAPQDFVLQFTFKGKPSGFSLTSHGGKLSIKGKDLDDCPKCDGFAIMGRPLRKIL